MQFSVAWVVPSPRSPRYWRDYCNSMLSLLMNNANVEMLHDLHILGDDGYCMTRGVLLMYFLPQLVCKTKQFMCSLAPV